MPHAPAAARLVALAAALALGAPAPAHAASAPEAKGGVLDLRGWDPGRDGVVDLDGEWRLAGGRLEDPARAAAPGTTVRVPASWNGVDVPGKPAGADGFGTYRLRVECGERAPLALLLPIEHSALHLFANGRLVAEQGAPAASAALARPAFVQQVVQLGAAACPLELVAQVSNYDMRNGGLLRSIELGTAAQLAARREYGMARDLFALGALAVLSLLPVLVFFWRREERAALWLGCYGLSSAAFIGLGGERLFQPLIAPLGWQAAWKIVFLLLLAGAAAFPAFLRELYPALYPRRLFRGQLWLAGGLALLVLATPTRVFTLATPLLYAAGAAMWVMAVVVPARAALRGQRSAWLLLAGSVVLTATAAHDSLDLAHQISDKLTPYGMLLFALAPVLLLARRFARALTAEELRTVEQQQRADLLLHATQAGVLDWDALSRRYRYTERFAEMLGHPPGTDTSGWPPLFDFIHPEDRERIRASFLEQLRDTSVKSGVRVWPDSPDFRLRKADGGWLWIHASALSLTGADGRTLRQVCAFIDISQRKRQEEALRASEARYDAAMRAVNEGVYDWNLLAGTIFYSDSVYRALGMPATLRTPKDWRERIHPDDLPAYDAALVAHFKGRSERFACEYRYRGPDGGWRWARQHGIAVRDATGRAVRLVGATGDVTELKLAELALADRTRFVTELVDALPISVALRDAEGRYVLVNRTWERYFGVRREDALGRRRREFPGWDGSKPERAADAEAVERLDREMLALGPDHISEPQETLRLGRWYLITRRVLAGADGRPMGVLSAGLDMTERRAIEEALATEQRRLDLVVRGGRVGVVDWDGRTHATYYSPIFREILGHPADADTSGWPDYFQVLIHPEDRERVTRRWRAFILGKSDEGRGEYYAPEEYRLLRADGGYVWVQVSGVAVRDERGFVARWIAAVTDVSERHEHQEALARERERLALLVRATKAGFMDWDAAADTREYSARFKEMLGYPPDADTAQWPSLFDMMHPEDREPMRDAFRDMLRKGAAGGDRMHGPLEYRLRKADGSYVWVRGEGIAQVGPDGRTERFLTSYIDITPLREMNLALAESVRLREEVDRISRHDLKTPLNSIIGIPRLLRDGGRLAKEDEQLLAFVEQAGYRLLNMVNLSLDMFRMEQGSYPFSPKAVELRPLLERIARDLSPHSSARRVAVAIEGPGFAARGEELLCYSMLANLVKNAIEASPEGGAVGIALGDAGDGTLRVEIRNAGAVPEAMRVRFFQKYATAGKSGGTGLGTYSARLMARTQQGDIAMRTGAEGTVLTVTLRAATQAERAAAERERLAPRPEAPAAASAVPEAISALLVDDDDYSRVYVRSLLPASAKVEEAGNGFEALERAAASPPGIILMDIDMPVMGGLEAAAKWRRRERGEGRGRIPMIARSSHDGAAIREQAREAGFDLYLEKPVSPDALRRALAQLLGSPGPADPVPVAARLRNALPGFLESRRELVGRLEEALAAGDAAAARALAHKLAGGFALYGFRWAAEQGKLIERRAGGGALDGLAAMAAGLRRHLEAVRVEIRE